MNFSEGIFENNFLKINSCERIAKREILKKNLQK